MRINMITNAICGDVSLISRAKQAGLEGIGFSLDGLEPAHDRNRGVKGHFGKVMQMLEYPDARNLPTNIITTIWKVPGWT
jgi:MoaA/NifB/PqqE/SkfB family radical SAM enzyme